MYVSTGRAGGFTVAGPSKGPFRNRPKQKQEQKQKPRTAVFTATAQAIREKNILPEFSKFYCHPGRAGGSPHSLVVHDTTKFSYKREDMAAVGLVSEGSVRKDAEGRTVYFTICGINLPSSLALTLEGLLLELTAVKFWNPQEFKGRKAKRKAHNAPIEEKESVRWLENLRSSIELRGQPHQSGHVGDQESDIFDLFGAAQPLRTHFLVHTRTDRLADGGPKTIADTARQSRRRGLYRILVTIERASHRKRYWKFVTDACVFRPPKASRNAIRIKWSP